MHFVLKTEWQCTSFRILPDPPHGIIESPFLFQKRMERGTREHFLPVK